MRVAVVHNDPKPTCLDSLDVLDEAAYVTAALDSMGVKHMTIAASDPFELVFEPLAEFGPDIVFNLIEEPIGLVEPHAAASMLGLMGYRYTGTGPEGIMLSTDKTLAKTLMRASGIPTPEAAVYRGGGLPDLSRVPGPWIVKPALEDASVGITDGSVFSDQAALMAALPAIYSRHGQPLLIERLLTGREVCVPMLEIDGAAFMLPPSEMRYLDWPEGKPRILGYDAKWTKGTLEYENSVRDYHPAGLPIDEVRALAMKCWAAFRLGGYARVDMRLDEGNRPYVIEINPNPCISPDAGYVAALEEAGHTHEWFIRAVLASAHA